MIFIVQKPLHVFDLAINLRECRLMTCIWSPTADSFREHLKVHLQLLFPCDTFMWLHFAFLTVSLLLFCLWVCLRCVNSWRVEHYTRWLQVRYLLPRVEWLSETEKRYKKCNGLWMAGGLFCPLQEMHTDWETISVHIIIEHSRLKLVSFNDLCVWKWHHQTGSDLFTAWHHPKDKSSGIASRAGTTPDGISISVVSY